MELSVLIAARDAASTIEETLASLADQQWSGEWEVIVCDNGSIDETLSVVERWRGRLPELRVVQSTEHDGCGHARNVAFAASRGNKIAMIDADDIAAPGWLDALARALDEHDVVAGRFEYEKLNDPVALRSRACPQQAGLQFDNNPPYLPHSMAGNMGMRRHVFEEVGGFDVTFKNVSDTDLSWRLQQAGYEIFFTPEPVVHLRLRADLRDMYQQARRYALANVYLYHVHRPRGMPKRNWVLGLLGWVRLPILLVTVRNRATLAAWLWQLGWRVGRLRGSVKYRRLAF